MLREYAGYGGELVILWRYGSKIATSFAKTAAPRSRIAAIEIGDCHGGGLLARCRGSIAIAATASAAAAVFSGGRLPPPRRPRLFPPVNSAAVVSIFP